MADRLAEDHEKLVESVGIFRVRANLHGSSSDPALIQWAHEGGKARPYADMVRTAWHDFEQGRMVARLEVERYRIKYPQEQRDLFAGGEPSVGEEVSPPADRGSGAGKGKVAAPDVSGTAASPDQEPSGAAADPFCAHKGRVNDGKRITCDACGEVLEELPPCEHRNTKRDHLDGSRLACLDCGQDAGPAQPEKSMDNPPAIGEDDEEILY